MTPARDAAPSGRPILLNVGCGLAVHPGWENLDASPNARLARRPRLRRVLARAGVLPRALAEVPWPSIVRVVDASRRLPYGDGTVDAVFSSHFLEHLAEARGRAFLAEAFRVLRPHGVIRTVVPDLEAYARRYVGGLAEGGGAAADTFMTQTCLGEAPRAGLRGWLHDRLSGNHHRYMYDRHSLADRLRAAGFVDIEPRGYGESRIAAIKEVEQEDRFVDAICLEATRPPGTRSR